MSVLSGVFCESEYIVAGTLKNINSLQLRHYRGGKKGLNIFSGAPHRPGIRYNTNVKEAIAINNLNRDTYCCP